MSIRCDDETAGVTAALPVGEPRWWDAHMREIARGASTAFVLKALGALLTFGFYVEIGRLLGPTDAGLYFLALTVITIGAVVGRVGLDNTVLRFVAAHDADEDWVSMKGAYRQARRIAVLASFVTATGIAVSGSWLAHVLFKKPELAPLLRWMAFAVVPVAVLTLQAQALQGLKRIAESTLVGSVGVPLLSLAAAAVLAPLWGSLGAVQAYTLAALLTMIFGVWRWRAATRRLRPLAARFDLSVLLDSSIPLFWVSCLQLVIASSSTVALGLLGSSADVGIYNAAYRTAMLTSFVLMAVNSISAPKFAALYRQGDLPALGRIARKSTTLMAALAAPVLLVFTVFPTTIMGLFGGKFAAGASALSILAIGQFVNVITGSVGWILIMCGYERLMRNIIAGCAVTSVVLNAVLIPGFGVLGAAIATATALALQMVLAAALVWRKLGLVTIPVWYGRSHSV